MTADSAKRPRGGGYTAHASALVPRALLSHLIDDPTDPFSDQSAKIVKEGDTTRVVRAIWRLHGAPTPVAYKCVRRLTWFKKLTQAVGPNRTWRAYRAGERLLELGIPTARPLLILVPRRWHWQSPTWLANEWLEDARQAGELVRDLGRRNEEWRLDELARELGNVLGRLHRAGGTHRDLKAENIMARLADGNRPPGVWLIDLDGLRFRRWISSRRRGRDLSRLVVGVDEAGGVRQTLRLRFLRAYLQALGDEGDWKRRWQSLRRATERRMRQRRRKS